MSESQEPMNEESSRDDRAALMAVARLMASGRDVPVPASATDADEDLVREYLEVLGLLPYGLEPEAPRPETKARILTQIGEYQAAHEAAPSPAVLPERSFDEVTLAQATEAPAVSSSDPIDVTLQQPVTTRVPATPPGMPQSQIDSIEPSWPEPVADATGVEAARATPTPTTAAPTAPTPTAPTPSAAEATTAQQVVQFPAATVQPPPRAWWSGALAASLVFCVAGLAYLTGKVNEQNRTIARLTTELQLLPVDDLTSMNEQLVTMRRRFHMVTSIARQAYHLEEVENPGNLPQPAEGVVYVCGKHQRWYLNVQGLDTPPDGKEYRMWFVTGGGMIDGGVVNVEEDASSEMEAMAMPNDTQGFAVTLEETGHDDDPEGIMVLLGEAPVKL